MYTKQKNSIIIFMKKHHEFHITTAEMLSKFMIEINVWGTDFETDYFSH